MCMKPHARPDRILLLSLLDHPPQLRDTLDSVRQEAAEADALLRAKEDEVTSAERKMAGR